MAPADTVILDFDGVIADSMPQHLEAYRRVLEPYGVQVTKLDVYRREGARSESIIRTLLGDHEDAHDEKKIHLLADEKQKIFQGLGEVSLYPKAERFVREVRDAAKRLGLVTGTRRGNLDRWAGGLVPLFDAVLAEDSYSNDKPHPEPYEKAIVALEAQADACIVVENAPRGVQSAKAAGAGLVVAVTTTLPRDEFEESGPDIIADDHEAALEAVLEALAAP